MNNAATKTIKTAIWVTSLILTLSVVVTGTVLCSRIKNFLQYEKSEIIELSVDETVKESENTDSGNVVIPAAPTEKDVTTGKFNPSFEASDDKVKWGKETEVEIFKISYNETGDVTVDGVDDKVFAPGTGNTYNFSLKNTGNVTLDYTLSAEVKFSHSDITLPISVRMNQFDGEYLVGSKTAYEPAAKLNGVSDKGTLTAGKYANYALEWQWPFESETGDEFDTELGNRAVDEDITMTVILRTAAEADYVEQDSPDTGDIGITVFVIIAVAAVAVMLMLLILLKKTKEEKKENE